MSIEAIIFYILLIDAIGANVMVHFGSGWYVRLAGPHWVIQAQC